MNAFALKKIEPFIIKYLDFKASQSLLILMMLMSSGFAFSIVPLKKDLDHFLPGEFATVKVLRPKLVSLAKRNRFEQNISIWQDELSSASRVYEFKSPILLPTSRSDFGLAELASNVLKYVDAHKDLFQISAVNLKLNLRSSIFSEKYQFLKFDVYMNGILIKNANFDVRLIHRRIVQIINESYNEGRVRPQNFSLGESTACNPFLSIKGRQKSPDYFRVIQSPTGYEIIPVSLVKSWKVEGDDVNLEVNLNSNAILNTYSDSIHASLPVLIPGFSRNASEFKIDVPYSFGTLIGAKDQISYFTDAKAEIPEGSYLFNNLSGQTANIISSDPKFRLSIAAEKKKSQGGFEFLSFSTLQSSKAPENNELFAFGTVYSALTVVKQIVASIDPQLSSWLTSPNTAFVNENDECNAYYVKQDSGTSKAGSLNFLQGLSKCNNTGNMADIVAHEWAHGLDDATGGIDDQAFSEGFGDAMAFSIFFKPDIGSNLRKDGLAIRDISIFKHYPEDQGEFHAEGLIIANTFFDLYSSLAKLKPEIEAKRLFRTYLYQSIKAAKKYTDVYDFLMAFEDNLKLKCTIHQVFKNHGLGRPREEC